MTYNKGKLPAITSWILRRILGFEDRDSILSDFSEIYNELTQSEGPLKARRWFWGQVIRSLPKFILNLLYWRIFMKKNDLKITLRNIKRNKGYSFINIFGLAVGIACCIFIMLWVNNELSYDRFHKNVQNIYHVLAHTDVKNIKVTPAPLARTLKEKYPEIVDYARFHWFFENTSFTYKNKNFNEKQCRIADPSFFKIFSFSFLEGDADNALKNPQSIVITRSIAEKYFDGEDPLGKILTMNNQHKFTVTGVIENIPANSTLKFNMIVPMAFRIANTGKWYMNWDNLFPYTFIKLNDTCSSDQLNTKIAGIIQKNGGGKHVTITLLPFADRYFSQYSDKAYIYVFITIALFILAIACFNFINLSTARSVKRAKEIGLRKIVGANRMHIIRQFLGESMIFSFAAVLFALILVALLLPWFNRTTGKEILMNFRFILPISLVLPIFTGFAAGSYPAFFLSAFQPAKVLKGQLKAGSKRFKPRKTLVIVQFSISILLIIGMLIVYKQINFVQNKDIGYDKEHIVSIAMGGGSEKYYKVLKDELLKDQRILGVTGSAGSLPYFNWQQTGFHWEGKDLDKKISVSFNAIDYDFVETLKIKIVEGRSFSEKFSSDTDGCFLINREMAKLMGVKSAAGMILIHGGKPGKIVGVIENFHFHTLQNQIEPLILKLEPDTVDNMLIRIRHENIASTVSFIKKAWQKLLSSYPFEYRFLDEDLAKRYTSLEKTGVLLNGFALLAVIISCLGLFGLSSFAAEQRTKEIGIRKVLGSSVSSIVSLLINEFTRCVVLANIIAWPLSYYLMNQWLHRFAYRTNINLWIFVISALISLGFALLTVSYQSIKAARANPIDSLRYE